MVYYLVGLGLAGISYLTVEHGYKHGPALHHLLILLTCAGGVLWLAGAVIQYLRGRRTENIKGIIFTNLFVSLGFVLFMAYILNDAGDNKEIEPHADRVSIRESGDTVTMYHGGSVVYMKVRDSVMINFIDSARIDWDNVTSEHF